MKLGRVLLTCAALACGNGALAADDVVIADFEGPDYGIWTVEGTAFGTGPAHGTLPGQMTVSGFIGHGLVNSFVGGDGATGKLTSPGFEITRRYINFLMGGGMNPGQTCMNLIMDGKVVRTATGPNDRPGGTERLDWRSWDVSDFRGQKATLEIVDSATGGWGHINVDEITMSDEKQEEDDVRTDQLYDETYRPQFHFTAKAGWHNDPNGLVYYRGEYHMFFQHNPFGTDWGNMTWGHAISRDLVHWHQIANAIEPDGLGTIFSGSAIVDANNTAGWKSGPEKTLVAIYTAAGGTSDASKGKPFTQCVAYSNDRGRTWTKYSGNPVVPHVAAENRDPKVVWYAPTRRWIMALYLDKEDYALFASPDLKTWQQIQTVSMPGSAECPDFFEMPVDGEQGVHKWVFTGANGHYMVGDFDGKRFTPDGAPQQVDYGASYYAVQTYSGVPASDGRRIQIAWMNGGVYPKMPFNQQMSFPCEMRLKRFPEGLRIVRWPVKEIRTLWGAAERVSPCELDTRKLAIAGAKGNLYDIEMVLEPRGAAEVGLVVRGAAITFRTAGGTLSCLEHTAPVALENGRLRLRVLVDRTSVEVFAQGGRVSMTSCFLPRAKDTALTVFADGGRARLRSMTVRNLKSAWAEAAAK